MSDSIFGPCPACGEPKRRYMACEHCGYSFIGTELAKQSSPSFSQRPSLHDDGLEGQVTSGAAGVGKPRTESSARVRRVRITNKRPKASHVAGHRPSLLRAVDQTPQDAADHDAPDTDLPAAGGADKSTPPKSDD